MLFCSLAYMFLIDVEIYTIKSLLMRYDFLLSGSIAKKQMSGKEYLLFWEMSFFAEDAYFHDLKLYCGLLIR